MNERINERNTGSWRVLRDRMKESNLNDFVTFVHNQLNEYEFIISHNSAAAAAAVAVERLLEREKEREWVSIVNHFSCSLYGPNVHGNIN